MRHFLSIAACLACSACAHATDLRPVGTPLSYERLIAGEEEPATSIHDVRTRGIIYPLTIGSVFLTSPSEILPSDETVPQPERCIHVLVSPQQLRELRRVAKEPVTLVGDIIYLPHGKDELITYLTIRGRHTHLYCQYSATQAPLIYLKQWSR
jgi:hypothetical protein